MRLGRACCPGFFPALGRADQSNNVGLGADKLADLRADMTARAGDDEFEAHGPILSTGRRGRSGEAEHDLPEMATAAHLLDRARGFGPRHHTVDHRMDLVLRDAAAHRLVHLA
jgi:hypothetical protein